MPELRGGAHLLDYFFRMGPATKDGPLSMQEVRAWAPVLTGYDDWKPWEAELMVQLSREYCVMQQEATKRDCLPPWPPAVPMWRWVQGQRAEKSWDREERLSERQQKRAAKQGAIPNGNRK